MALRDLVTQSQLIPPRQRKGVLHRPRLGARLAAALDYPLTIVQASTGYGKSTALAGLGGTVDRLFWYTVSEPDRDPLLFLAHLISAFGWPEPGLAEPAMAALEAAGGREGPAALTPLLNSLTTGLSCEAVLVLDDYHLVDGVPGVAALVEHLVDHLPPRLHVAISCRQVPRLSALTRWRVKGQVLTLTRADLAFTAPEIEHLFREQYGCPISPEQAQRLLAETEGWAIALQMIWQGLQSGAVSSLDAVLERLPSTLEALFDYLAQEVLARQPLALQRFLLTTAVLRQMDGAACDHLLGAGDSTAMLRQLSESGLFVVYLGKGNYRYQRLFHDFLQAQLCCNGEGDVQARSLHRRAADYFRQSEQPEETVYHLLEAHDYAQAAELLQAIGPDLLSLGRYDSLTGWIGRLPHEVQAERPHLALLMGDVLRLRAHFDEALEHYAVAERGFLAQGDRPGRSQALRGQAQVYLDTVRPLKADSLLEEALRLLEPQEHRQESAALLEQLAENRLNQGHPDQAEALHHEARLLRADADPGDLYLEARAMLRTGRLASARQLLEKRAEEEGQADGPRPQRFHRETQMLLSLVCAFMGDTEATEAHARAGLSTGQRLNSPFVEAVGKMRLGHARQLQGTWPWDNSPLQQAIDCYQRAIEQVHVFKVLRVQVEPLWGLCRACGYAGDLANAEPYAWQAGEIALQAGDEWLANLVRVTLGAGYTLSGRTEPARHWLAEAAAGFEQVGDPFGRSAAQIWLALNAWAEGNVDQAMQHVAALLPSVQERGHEVLLTRRTHLGLKDDQAAIPLLIEARQRGIASRYVGHLLHELGLDEAGYHPGYTLFVRTLGSFAVWRGDVPVAAREWQREKARQLLQLLLTCRGQWLHREQIADRLWPQLGPDAAARDFKVALNALNRALEPGRPPGAAPFFVVRRDNLYGLNPAARLVVDADGFERLAASDDVASLRQALAWYEGDYLPEALYEDWPAATRERLRLLYTQSAGRLCQFLLDAGAWDETADVCRAVLAYDNCSEAAYCALMRAHAAQGNRAQVRGTYQQCVAALREELDLDPSPETRSLYAQLS